MDTTVSRWRQNQQKVPEAERGLANVRELGSDRRERSPGQVLRGTLTHQRNLASTLKETLKFINKDFVKGLFHHKCGGQLHSDVRCKSKPALRSLVQQSSRHKKI